MWTSINCAFLRNGKVRKPRLCARALLGFGSAEALCSCLLLAHVSACFGRPVTLVTGKVINLRREIYPHDKIDWTLGFCLGFGLKLTGACGRRRRCRRGWLGCRGGRRCGGSRSGGRRSGGRRSGGRSRSWRRCRGGGGQRDGLACTALGYIHFFGNSSCLVCSLVGPPFILTGLYGLRSRNRSRRRLGSRY
jgi:hypothetical protein